MTWRWWYRAGSGGLEQFDVLFEDLVFEGEVILL
jgi:hypothetical protein